MSRSVLAVVADEGSLDPLRRWVEPTLRHWPHGRRPKVVLSPRPDALPETEDADAALLILGGRSTVNSARLLIDRLHRRGWGGVVLTPQAQTWRDLLAGEGVLVESTSADPAYLAALLHALSERQPAMRRYQAELRVAQSAQGGLCGEMDRLHEELMLAATVQKQFIPRVAPDSGPIRFAWVWRPAGYVSGDIFDIRRLDEHRWGFFIADVVGHGVPAALLTMVLARSLVTKVGEGARERLLEPCEALAGLNRELCAHPDGPQRLATAVYGTIDGSTRQVRLSVAGHPLPMVVAPGRETRRIDAGGPLLGVFDGAEFEQEVLTLADDESLVLYSDGLELAFPDAGESRLGLPTRNYVEHLARLAPGVGGASLAVAMSRLEAELDAQAGSLHRADDVTALAITCSPLAAEQSRAA